MLKTLDLEEAAKEAAGNWRKFRCFVWWREREMNDADQWAIIYTDNRDSGLIDQSNAAVIRESLVPFTKGRNPTVVFERHDHWVCGHVDGFSIRVFSRGRITKAFRKYFGLLEQLDSYSILDDTDYCNREYESALEGIDLAAWRLAAEFILPENWTNQVYDWLSENAERELANIDDQGAYPSEESLRDAFEALEFEVRDQ